MKIDPQNYWNPVIFKNNARINIKNVVTTINDLKFNEQKILVCGRRESSHPDFFPKFSTPTTNVESTLYVTVDHDPHYVEYITRKGNYALSLIVDPTVAKKISDIGGKIFWFSHEFLDDDLPKILCGKSLKSNSGLAAISLASYFGAKSILLSGITLSEKIYHQFHEGKKIVFENINTRRTKIFSLDGVLAKQLKFDDWCSM